MPRPKRETATPAEEGAAAKDASGEANSPDSLAADMDQTEEDRGSWDFDDPERPRWDFDTILQRTHDYTHADGRYAYSVLVGVQANKDKAVLRGRRVNGSNDLQEARRANELYPFPGLEIYRRAAPDEPRLLYRLPELLAAMGERPGDPVFITEGEKDADTCIALGLIATTNPSGALSWKPEFNELFEGRHVVVMVDNDDNGRLRAAAILDALSPIAASLKAVELPGLRVNGDVTDWLDTGKSLDDLLKVVGETDEVTSADDWRNAHRQFVTNDDGKPYRSPENVRIALARLGVRVRYDEFACRYLLTGLQGFGPVLDDPALTRLRLLTEENLRLSFAKERWGDIVTDYARNSSFHPVREYLGGLKWDGTPRLDRWLVTYAGAQDSEYVRAVGAICIIAAVRRVRVPGCKFDEMLVLESGQGTGKSTALAILAGEDDWFADDVPLDADSKVVMERIAGRWICELAELKGMRRGAVEQVKAMLSRRVDKARLSYGRMTTEQPRQCVFFGTTNDSKYLRDMTGNRRFWPVVIGEFDLSALRKDRDQLWAEAAEREAQRESIRLPEHLWAVAGEHQADREIGDPIYEVLSERLDGMEGKVRACDIWEAVGLGDKGRRTQDHNNRVSAVMQKLGWRRPKSVLRFAGKPQHAWVKGPDGATCDAFHEVPRSVVLGLGDNGNDGRAM